MENMLGGVNAIKMKETNGAIGKIDGAELAMLEGDEDEAFW